MNNLTTTILNRNSRYDIEESVKQGRSVSFDNGKEQRIIKYSIPSVSIVISYNGLSDTEFTTLRTAYENNYANTFICDFNSFLDKRPEFMTLNSSVWAFKTLEFIKTPSGLINGEITIFTSLFFNFTEYQDLFEETSTNTIITSTDTSFTNVLENAPVKAQRFSYMSNTLLSSIGRSMRHQRDKTGLKRLYTFTWLLQENSFLELLTFYRKNSGIMGEFGCPDLIINSDIKFNARFLSDSLRYVRRLDGFYECEANIIEVK